MTGHRQILSDEMDKYRTEKPEVGFKPEPLWLEERITEIDHAMNRRIAASQHIPIDWINERNKHLRNLRDLKKT